MNIGKPNELVGKEVYDKDGNAVGIIDKTWNSWNQNYPGCFFGLRPNESTREKCFRGTYKLVPIYNDHIREVGEHVTLNRSLEELYRFWNKTVQCGQRTCPSDELLDKPVYDKNHSRIGTFCAWVESDGPSRHFGILIDPFLCDTWKTQCSKMMPVPTNYITNVKDTVTLDRTLDELKEYWNQHFDLK